MCIHHVSSSCLREGIELLSRYSSKPQISYENFDKQGPRKIDLACSCAKKYRTNEPSIIIMRQAAHNISDTKLSSNSVYEVVLKRSNETINDLKRYKLHFHKDTCFRSKLKTTNCIIQITNQINYLQRCRVRWQLAWDRCEFFAFATNGYFQVCCWTITRYWTRSRWSSGDKKRCKQ